MKNVFTVLKSVGLFRGVSEGNLEAMLNCLGAETIAVIPGEILLLAGDKPKHIGIVLAGQLQITKEDYNGNRTIITAITTGGVYAEALCCAGVEESPVMVIASADSVIMRLSFSRILRTCPNSCVFHTKLIENMLGMIANKNLLLQSRMDILSLKSVRAKVLRYFETLNVRKGQQFTVPFNREEMADFICVERSALSHELAKMKRDGLIDYKKNSFTIFGSCPTIRMK